MRSLEELVNPEDSAIHLIRRWIERAESECQILSPSPDNERVLFTLQVSTHCTLGAIAYETGGILVDSGWLRFLGSGHRRMPRNLADWNTGRSEGFTLVADDVVGGFFATNRGAFGAGDDMYYWAPDSLLWEPIGFEFTDFFRWSLTSALSDFYQHFRWPTWRQEVVELQGDRCFNFCPYLWTKEGSVARSDRRPIPVAEAYDLKIDVRRQMEE